MKKIWVFLCVIGSLFSLILGTFIFSLKEEYELIYFNHTHNIMYTVKSVNSLESNKEILYKIQQYSKENNINVYRQITNINALTQYNQDIYADISNKELFKETFHLKSNIGELDKIKKEDREQFTNSEIKFYPFLKSEKEGIEGFYHFQSNELNEEALESFLNSLHLGFEKTKKLNINDILEYIENQPSIKPLVFSLIFYLITFVFVSLSEIFIRFKEIAILKMIGNKKKNIILKFVIEKMKLLGIILIVGGIGVSFYCIIFKEAARFYDYFIFSMMFLIGYSILVLFVYLILLLFIGLVDIPNMIKGKKNVKYIKPFHVISLTMFTVVIVFFLTNIRQEYNKYVESKESISQYSKLNGFVTTNLSISNDEKTTFQEIGQKLKKMTLEKYSDIVLYNTSSFFINGYEEYLKNVSEAKPFILVNENYFDFFPDLGIKKENIVQDSNTISLVIPKSLEHKKEELRDLVKILDDNKYDIENISKNKPPLKTQVIVYENKKIPIYTDSFKKYRFSKFDAPIFVVITKKNITSFGSVFNENLSAWYSSGSIFISQKEGNWINQTLIKEDLDRNIRNTVDIYSKLNGELKEILNEIIIYLASMFVLLVVYYNLIMFSTLTYLEEKKQEIFCRKIIGYSFLGLHKDYVVSVMITILTGTLLSYLITSVDLISTLVVIFLANLLIFVSLLVQTVTKKGEQ